jgi:hypothetical protein
MADFAAERGEGILGVSVEVGDLRAAHDLIQRWWRNKLKALVASPGWPV